jgi:hypothetical protein
MKATREPPPRIESQLDVLIRLVALVVAPDNLSLKDRALRLQRAGLSSAEIAPLCGSTSHIVSVILSAAKKSRKSAKASK